MTEVTAAAPPTCEARVGFHAGEFAEMPLWCGTTVGLTSWTDMTGHLRRACRHHLDLLLYRFPRRYVSEVDGDGLAESKRAREIVIEDQDSYVVTVDEDDEWTNREGMPEFSGQFR